MSGLAEMRQAVVDVGRQMIGRGLVAGTWGNISMRCESGDRIAITPSGRPYDQLTPEDIVVVDPGGQVLAGRRPSSELALHLAIYHARTDVRAVVHTHSLYATACAVAGKAIPASLEEMVQAVGGPVQVATYALPGTAELATNAVAALADRSAVLLANHGVAACGPSLSEALLVAELVEKAAHIHVVAQQLGGARELSDEDVALMRRFYLEHYRPGK
jgi:L-fuculose-phosphate aldolase